ncbi:hypothetical protein CY35_13G046000 [Sphagnum magellanicum]|nr:hypothetical protein CY35_13G046000 [Sphagnum magellanicum]
MALVLHAPASNKNAFMALVSAEYVGVKLELAPSFQMGVTNKSPEFLNLNPLGQVPVLETPEGPICESNAIARYVARLKDAGLFGTSTFEEAQIDQWCDFSSMEIYMWVARWGYPHFGMGFYNPEVEQMAILASKRAFECLNKHLAARTYVVGHSVTIADIILTCNLLFPFEQVLTKEFTANYPHVERYFWTMVNQPSFKKVVGKINQTDGPLPPPPSKGEAQAPVPAQVHPQAHGRHTHKEKVSKQKKETPKPAEAPKPVEAPKPLENDDEEEAPVKKSKNPLDFLPPSPMVMDNWKRLYSNTKAKDFHLAINGFWEMYDPEGYSLWFCDYKHNDENQVTFVTMNKVGGFLQRMDFIRKYAFSKMCILGESSPYSIKGVWLFRGTEIPQMVKDECYDVELYDWTKVDITQEDQKALVNAYFEEPDEIQGMKLLETKCFK